MTAANAEPVGRVSSMFPGILAETALTLWLLIAGANVQRWNEQARS